MNRTNVIEDLRIGLETLEDHKKLDEQIMTLVIECDALKESARKLIDEKKKGTIDVTEANARYDALVKKHDEVSSQLKKLEESRSRKLSSIAKIRMHIKLLEENGPLTNEFQIKWWSLLLEKAVVHDDGRIEFIYYSGYKNEVSID